MGGGKVKFLAYRQEESMNIAYLPEVLTPKIRPRSGRQLSTLPVSPVATDARGSVSGQLKTLTAVAGTDRWMVRWTDGWTGRVG